MMGHMALRLPEHSHCLHCGDPVAFGESYCDEDCLTAHRKETKRTNVKDFLFYATVAAALIAVTYGYIL